MEDYAAKMLLKTDAALREYVTGHAQYREAAVLAALDELGRRGQPAPEDATLRPLLAPVAEAERQAALAAAQAEAASRQATISPDSPEATGPALFSPGTIAVFTILVPVLGGAVLLALNLLRVRRWAGIALLALFVFVYLCAASLLLLGLVGSVPALLPFLPLLLAIPPLVAYLSWFWPRYFGGLPYRSRSWLPAFIICMLLLFGSKKMEDYLMKQQPKEVQQQMKQLMGK